MGARPRYIILVGSGKSGSSAVFDYLSGRSDVITAISGSEFKLGNDPDGLGDLGYAVGEGFHPNRASLAVKAFQALCNRYGRPRSALPPGMGYKALIPDYQEIVNEYLEALVDVEFKALPRVELTQLSPLKAYLIQTQRRYYRKLDKKPSIGSMKLPVAEDRFYEITSAFIDKLLGGAENTSMSLPKLVNQGGSFWRPVSSTRWFGERYVITVKRDPRDIFSDFKYKGYGYPGSSVELFIKWYKNVMGRIAVDEWRADNVISLQFEKIVSNPEQECEKLNARLQLDTQIKSSYDLSNSFKNVGLYKTWLDGREIRLIERELEAHLQDI